MSGKLDKQRILIFGGTFNPIHTGHVRLAKTAAEQLNADRLLIIPANIPPHKIADCLTDGIDRFNMCRLAFDGYDKAEISDIELRQTGKSYTINTLEQLDRLYPDSRFYLLMGADMFLSFTQWKDPHKIAQYAVLCAAARDEAQYNSLTQQGKLLKAEGISSIVLDIDPFEISSTEIRERLKNKQSCKGILPDKVIQYIEQKGLYQNAV